MIAKRARAVGAAAAISAAIGAAPLAGCAGRGGSRGDGAAIEASAFAATRVIIHPLTRVTRAPGNPGNPGNPGTPGSPGTSSGTSGTPGNSSGGASAHAAGSGEPVEQGAPTIVVHVAFVDAWGFEVRALAVLRLTLGDGPAGGERSWTFDLTGPEDNARRYDRVTRTYELPLPGTPEWVVGDRAGATTTGGAGSAEDAELGGRGARGALTLEAELVDGRVLTTSRRLGR